MRTIIAASVMSLMAYPAFSDSSHNKAYIA